MRLSEAAAALDGAYLGRDVAFRGCGIDSRAIGEQELFIALQGRRRDGHDFVAAAGARGAAAAMVERAPAGGASCPLLRVDRSRGAMGRLAARWRSRFRLPVVGVTGSNGKTTVKEMLAAVLALSAPVLATAGNRNNDLGVPLTLFRLGQEHGYAVIEMGANRKGEIGALTRMARPRVAAITQCAPAHLAGFGDIGAVAEAKSEIFDGLESGGAAVINADDRYAGLWRARARNYERITFGLERPADVTASDIEDAPPAGRQRFLLSLPNARAEVRLPLCGRHNLMNALAAAACAHALETPAERIREGLERMAPLRGRLQLRRGAGGSLLLDDSYNANPTSLQAGIEVMRKHRRRHWLALGDMNELGGEAVEWHRRAGREARARGVQRLYALGELAAEAAAAFGPGGAAYADLEALGDALAAELSDDVILLVKGSRALALERLVARLAAEA